ncbi:MAG TPA: kelch repeat-containing protein [Terriglobales bacterium]|nr:kelch repeat-containing protein [Terriglobales bacterium]
MKARLILRPLLVLTGIAALAQQPQMIDISARTAFQQAVEQVYWQHRLWPKENSAAKPALTAVISPEQLQAKAEAGLRLSNALAALWNSPITGAQLQAEMNRMARDSRQPEVLAELFAALNHDPAIVAEVLARPALAERLARSAYQNDQRFSAKAQSFDTWWSKQQNQFAPTVSQSVFAYVLPGVNTATAAPDSWAPTHTLPDGTNGMTAVWTGAEMIIWGGGSTLAPVYTGSRYDPATDTWHSTNNSSVPIGKTGHTAVWTGTEMIVWGGCDLFKGEHTCDSSSGQRYNPATDSWVKTSVVGAPHTRMNHTAVWTGTEMIVFGGCSFINDACIPSRVGNGGGRYNPSTDTWTPTNTANAPQAREFHTAVWTGNRMVVWGGTSDTAALNDGGVYNPGTDSWIATAAVAANQARYFHSGVWTGREMILWGGTNGTKSFNSGLRYNVATNKWRGTPPTNAPSPRSLHTAIWSGTEMIVWGGVNGTTPTNTGARFNPTTSTWTPTSTVNAPSARSGAVSVWTGSQMIVWGGFTQTGGRYDPATDSWTPTNAVMTPSGRTLHTAIWTGAEMIVWGGDDAFIVGGTNTGGRYNLALDTWTPTSTVGGPSGRHLHSALWTGTEMIIWGGQSGSTPFKDGGRYNPVTNAWTKTSTTGAPEARSTHTAVWTGTEMIVFGGTGNSSPWLKTGGRYNPSTNSWTLTTTIGAPTGRELHAAVWTGSEMIVWGGATSTFDTNTGARYNPATNTWTNISTVNAPSARNWTAYEWTGTKMLIWGGQTYNGSYVYHNDGALYDPASDTWTPTSLTGAPSGRGWFGYVWTGADLIVWGGCGVQGTFCSGAVGDGARYNPGTDLWTPISMASAPVARHQFPAVWTGSQMILWSGQDWTGFFLTTTGGVYTP